MVQTLVLTPFRLLAVDTVGTNIQTPVVLGVLVGERCCFLLVVLIRAPLVILHQRPHLKVTMGALHITIPDQAVLVAVEAVLVVLVVTLVMAAPVETVV